LQGHDRIRDAGKQGRRKEQQHDRAVHGEGLVELLGVVDELQPRLPQLGPDEHREHAAKEEEPERGDELRLPMTL
jgi:hypothetical protein